jgi:hypothetical protein
VNSATFGEQRVRLTAKNAGAGVPSLLCQQPLLLGAARVTPDISVQAPVSLFAQILLEKRDPEPFAALYIVPRFTEC